MKIYQNLVEKYRAEKYDDFIGQDKAVAEIKSFLENFPRKKAMILHGPAGTGKTSLVLSAVKENNLDMLELNASDLRNRAKLEDVLKPATLQRSLFKKGKIILMDEVDGVTGSDIGGIPELIRSIAISKFPIIMTCNDVWQSKLSQLRPKCKLVEMRALSTVQILSILKKVAVAEQLRTDENFLQRIAIKSQGDVRAALNDLHSYSQGDDLFVDQNDKRSIEESIFIILKKIFKERAPFLDLFDSTKMSLDEILLWLEENIPKEYSGLELAKAYHALGNADLFRGRIYKNQSWRFLVYQNIFQSAGISFAKTSMKNGFTKYEPPKRILKIWLNNRKIEKKKTISKKLAKTVHCSTKRAMKDYALLKYILKSNDSIQTQLKLSEEELEFLNK